MPGDKGAFDGTMLGKAFDLADIGLVVLDSTGNVVAWNAWMSRMSGIDEADAMGQRFETLFPVVAGTRLASAIANALERGVAAFLSRALNHSPLPLTDPIGGTEIEQNISVRPLGEKDDAEQYCLVQVLGVMAATSREAYLRDKTRENQALASRHKASEGELRAILDNLIEGVLTIDETGTILSLNRAIESIFGYDRDELLGNNVRSLMPEPHRSGHDDYIARYRDTGVARIIGEAREVEGRRRDGSTFPLDVSIAEVTFENQRLFAGVLRDISERCRIQGQLTEANRQLTELALYDHLTGLANRRLFSDHLNQFVARAGRRNERFALIYLDLDGFKPVNDTFGHAAGDELLSEVGSRLRACVRKGDVVARLGGDEFAMLLESMSDDDAIDTAATSLLKAIRKPVKLSDATASGSASIGIARHSATHDTPESILKAADRAMYAAKRQGKNRYVIAEA
ncbi:MAG: diguanylate cyclase [Alphaproteobacteria bacterium]|jgi:diguanylate cyclase (GGDEF)-like protein/PAS domain S-box-containing protein|nr:diguanylate cyclase [Alphaproteobacteria bacterium]